MDMPLENLPLQVDEVELLIPHANDQGPESDNEAADYGFVPGPDHPKRGSLPDS